MNAFNLKNQNRYLPQSILLILWLVINCIQAFFTDLHYDEAYYWIYSQSLNWGYFDHPPMVALWAHIGDVVMHNTLGFRLIFILSGVFVLWGIFRLIDSKKENGWLFFFILSFPLISSHMAGFLALPDLPLVFFFVLYLMVYKNYLKNDGWQNIILFAFVCAGLMYSKYHGGLIILLTLASNIRLLKRKSFWIAGLIAVVLFLPHVVWQYKNGFPSFVYHLSDRSSGFSIHNFLNYFGSQILLSGIFSGLLVVWLVFRFKPKNQFDKTLKFIAVGFWGFFTFMGFKGWIEAHWTAASMVAVIIISYKEIQNYPKIKKWVSYLMIPSVAMVFLLRIALMDDDFAERFSLKTDFHNYQNWIQEVDSIAGEKPILFVGNYHDPSRYAFQKNAIVPVVPFYNNRFAQYDLQRIDSVYHQKDVFAVGLRKEVEWKSKNRRKYKGSFINYYCYLGLELDDVAVGIKNDSIEVQFALINTTERAFDLEVDSIQVLQLRINYNNSLYATPIAEIGRRDSIFPNDRIEMSTRLIPDQDQKKISFDIGLSSMATRVQRLRKQEYMIRRD